MFFWTVPTALVIMLVSLSGVIVLWTGLGAWLKERLGVIASFSAGVFLIVAIQLIWHTLHAASMAYALLWVAVGALVLYLLFTTLPFFHHHHEDNCGHDHSMDINRILFSDGLHNIGDGLLLVASFQVSIAAGISAAVAIFVHEIVQEVSEFFVLKSAGLSTAKALLYNFAVSATILIGVGVGLLAVANVPAIRVPLLGIAGGSFLVVVGHDLIPHSARQAESTAQQLVHVGWFLCGVILMTLALLMFGH